MGKLNTNTLKAWSDKDFGVSFVKMEDSAHVVSNFSAGLSFAIPDKLISSPYINALELQKDTLNSISQVSEKLQIQNEALVTLMGKAVLPMTGILADVGLVSVNAAKLYEMGSINAQQLQLNKTISGLALETIQDYQGNLNIGLKILEQSGLLRATDGVTSSLMFASKGLSEMMRSLPTFPVEAEVLLPKLKDTHSTLDITDEEILEHQKKLDELLYKINPELVDFRKGVWQTFNNRGKDYVGQSSSSMRRLVDSLLRELAPQDKVRETEFFKTSKAVKDKNDRPTRKAKVLYLVGWDKNKTEHAKRIITAFLKIYDNLPAWDHTPISKHDFVYGTFIAIEGCLISILTLNNDE